MNEGGGNFTNQIDFLSPEIQERLKIIEEKHKTKGETTPEEERLFGLFQAKIISIEQKKDPSPEEQTLLVRYRMKYNFRPTGNYR